MTHINPTNLKSFPGSAYEGSTPRKLIVCCDGDYDREFARGTTNVEKIYQCLNITDPHAGFRQHTHICSVKSDVPVSFLSSYTDQPLINRAAEAYAFLAGNFTPGDQIYVFGCSAGAYVARLVAHMIGEIGMVSKGDAPRAARIFAAYQLARKSSDSEERRRSQEEIAPYLAHDSFGHKRVASSGAFSIQCLGLFEAVGSNGIIDNDYVVTQHDHEIYGLGKELGAHIQRVFHAIALDERRPSLDCNLLEQTTAGRDKGQVLHQCWFSGNHSDVAGSYSEHDLGDLALIWMMANTESFLSYNYEHLYALLKPVAPWGKLKPHHFTETGILGAFHSKERAYPTEPNKDTNETIHFSVLLKEPGYADSKLVKVLERRKALVKSLLPLEKNVRTIWRTKLRTAAHETQHSGDINSYLTAKRLIGL